MKKIVILGAGNMGVYIASNLAEDYDITVVDHSNDALRNINIKNISKQQADLSKQENIKSIVKDFDFVISALPEAFGYNALTTVIKAGLDIVDISFWEQSEERLAKLDKLAKENKGTVFIDCGIAPGFSNAIVAYFDNKLDGKTKNVNIYVGGIPKDESRGFFAPWSIDGLIEEYNREALFVSDGTLEKIPALSIREELDFHGVGILEAAITDGLRSIVFNLNHFTEMAEFTLRYPGHFNQMNLLKEIGYFNTEKLDVGVRTITPNEFSRIKLEDVDEDRQQYETVFDDLGFFDETTQYSCKENQISPRDVAVSVLSKKWKMRTDDRDILVLRISADDGNTKYTADVYAEHDGTNSAMAKTTGGMAALAAKAIMTKKFGKHGAFPIEKVIKLEPDLMEYFIDGLQNLGVKYAESRSEIIQ